MTEPVRVVQLSDTHFLEAGALPEGSHGYDTWAAFEAVLADIEHRPEPDLVVVTGDVADHGRAAQYEVAAAAFARLPAPVHVCPGNHDFDAPCRDGFAGTSVSLPRVTEHGPWAFVYVDSNAGRMVGDGDGGRVDPPGEDRLHGNGALGADESDWIRSTVGGLDAEHVFVWVHHPPAADTPLAADDDYTDEWLGLVDGLHPVRGFGAGHTHVPSTYEFAGRPVFVAPSFKNNFDLDADTWLPPGYRTYEFHGDGRVTSELRLVDDERWPRRPLGRAVRSLLMGELTYAELEAIVARRAAATR